MAALKEIVRAANVPIAAKTFEFTVPAGADVIEQ